MDKFLSPLHPCSPHYSSSVEVYTLKVVSFTNIFQNLCVSKLCGLHFYFKKYVPPSGGIHSCQNLFCWGKVCEAISSIPSAVLWYQLTTATGWSDNAGVRYSKRNITNLSQLNGLRRKHLQTPIKSILKFSLKAQIFYNYLTSISITIILF